MDDLQCFLRGKEPHPNASLSIRQSRNQLCFVPGAQVEKEILGVIVLEEPKAFDSFRHGEHRPRLIKLGESKASRSGFAGIALQIELRRVVIVGKQLGVSTPPYGNIE